MRKPHPWLSLALTKAGEVIGSPPPQQLRKLRLRDRERPKVTLLEDSASRLCQTPVQPPRGTPSKRPRPSCGAVFLGRLCLSWQKLAAALFPSRPAFAAMSSGRGSLVLQDA